MNYVEIRTPSPEPAENASDATRFKFLTSYLVDARVAGLIQLGWAGRIRAWHQVDLVNGGPVLTRDVNVVTLAVVCNACARATPPTKLPHTSQPTERSGERGSSPCTKIRSRV